MQREEPDRAELENTGAAQSGRDRTSDTEESGPGGDERGKEAGHGIEPAS